MPGQRIVRCEVRRRPEDTATVRFIPLEIFGLWTYLMRHKHGFEVVESEASLWVDLEDSPEIAYSGGRHIPVTEVSVFVYSDPAGMFSRISRYFPTAEYSRLRGIFLSHYVQPEAVPGAEPPVQERHGLWVHRDSTGS